MKRTILLCLLITIIFGCSEDDSVNSTQQYSYEIKKEIMTKQKIEANLLPNSFSTLGIKSYALDTLEIDLNGSNANSLKLEISYSYDLLNQFPPYNREPVIPHVNYIKFINLRPNWKDNITQHIYFMRQNNDTFFTYSESNINLNEHPNLFIYDKNNPTNIILNKAPKIGVDTETIRSNLDHSINSVIFRYNELTQYKIFYKVISKREL